MLLTTTRFAAMELAAGKILADCLPQHRHQEWLQFLKKIDAETPAHLDLHLIVPFLPADKGSSFWEPLSHRLQLAGLQQQTLRSGSGE